MVPINPASSSYFGLSLSLWILDIWQNTSYVTMDLVWFEKMLTMLNDTAERYYR
ncbi:hypothetical protein [Helicobacter zhangjianzhongii]|uniref:Uncharacterized protein n=1 Tax=Helicobacter zhangjianzhongii TaxID=2974574 RepID=A0ACC6FSC5_9HELI|nr:MULTISPECIES: hypothetical protein [unclassified Helicobacter]MDL0079733.1 hypothetical protein [Helicobacter sp. CPD2-1]MDL0082173.1 hypothetical protein [Helicobacter sp. XJK30-2]